MKIKKSNHKHDYLQAIGMYRDIAGVDRCALIKICTICGKIKAVTPYTVFRNIEEARDSYPDMHIERCDFSDIFR